MFYGILATLLFEGNDRHHLPHFHVRYQDDKSSIAIEDGRVLAGSLPHKQLKLVQAWVELHRDELACQKSQAAWLANQEIAQSPIGVLLGSLCCKDAVSDDS